MFAFLLVVGMFSDEFAHPVSRCHQFATGSFLDEAQVLMDCAVRVRIHFNT